MARRKRQTLRRVKVMFVSIL